MLRSRPLAIALAAALAVLCALPLPALAERVSVPERVVSYSWPASGAPVTGCWLRGAQVLDADDAVNVCTASGCPGTWASLAAVGGPVAAVDVTVADADENYTGTTVEAILAELPAAIQGLVDSVVGAVAGDLAGHIGATPGAHAASAISLLDTGDDYEATDVEGALAEVIGAVQTTYGIADGAATTAAAAIPKSLATAADQYLYSTAAGVWAAGTAGASTLLGKGAIGAVTALSASEARTILNVTDGAQPTNATTVGAAGALMTGSCGAANTFWGCTGMGTSGVRTTAQTRASLGIDFKTGSLCPTIDAPDGSNNNVAVDTCVADGVEVYTTLTGNAAGQDRASCHSLYVEAAATAWESITLRYKVSGGGAAVLLKIYDADDPIGTPCYTSASSTSTSYATITAGAVNLAGCTLPVGGFVRVCAFCNVGTAEVCTIGAAIKDVE